MLTLKKFAAIYDASEGEPEFTFRLQGMDHDYMVIKYADGPTFQRCGVEDGSGEFKFPSLAELLHAEQIDGICLCRDWQKVESVVADGMWDLDSLDDLAKLELGIANLDE